MQERELEKQRTAKAKEKAREKAAAAAGGGGTGTGTGSSGKQQAQRSRVGGMKAAFGALKRMGSLKVERRGTITNTPTHLVRAAEEEALRNVPKARVAVYFFENIFQKALESF